MYKHSPGINKPLKCQQRSVAVSLQILGPLRGHLPPTPSVIMSMPELVVGSGNQELLGQKDPTPWSATTLSLLEGRETREDRNSLIAKSFFDAPHTAEVAEADWALSEHD
ncbi:hypothetical protein DPEC_G00356870 [Dallia pectoralis]|uniref:Uncharacterized protein n=1 Tax=Dallia pectoralis TaxID=75939 RepID=A0ACC2EZX5_DALPE|nr:hypothetical protein DPEC_G00356870 [Dallia pectoralis]